MAEASPSSMSAAAQAYQESMDKYGQREQSAPAPTPVPLPAPVAAPALSTTISPALSTTAAPPLSNAATPLLPTTTAAAEDTPMADAAVNTASRHQRCPPSLVHIWLISTSQTSPAPLAPSTNSAPAPQRTATPTRTTNGNVMAEVTAPMPSKAAPHGAPARRYLNEKVTGVLLEGMKRLAAEQYVSSPCS